MKDAKDSRGHILLVAPEPYYEPRGTPIAVHLLLNVLSELGYRVDVLTFPTGQAVSIPGVNIHRVWNPLRFKSIPIGFSYRKLFLDVLLLIRVWMKLLTNRYDCIHAVEEGAYILLLACRTSAPVIYDMASSIPQQLLGHPSSHDGWIRARLRTLEKQVIRKAAFVVCSSGLEARVAQMNRHDGVDSWRFPAVSSLYKAGNSKDLRRQLRIPDEMKVVMYTGSFAAYQGLKILFDAIPLVEKIAPNIVVVCVGATDLEYTELASTLDDSVNQKLRIVKRQPSNRIPTYLAMADLLVSTRDYGENLPLKVIDYIATGKPVLVSDCPAHDSVRSHVNVHSFDASPDSLARVIVRTLHLSATTCLDKKEDQTPAEDPLLRRFQEQVASIYQEVIDKHRLRNSL